jgi:hypothetical protein
MKITFDNFWYEFSKGAEVDLSSERWNAIRTVAACAWDAALLSVVAHVETMTENKELLPPSFVEAIISNNEESFASRL